MPSVVPVSSFTKSEEDKVSLVIVLSNPPVIHKISPFNITLPAPVLSVVKVATYSILLAVIATHSCL